jgi:phenylpyruvate tautomerase PptA (4-oxalocrotonate tautomerase family)
VAQIKIYGLASSLRPIRAELSDVVHSCVVDALQLPADKRFHRFMALERDDFVYPPGRSERYTIVEVSMFEGRSIESKKQLIRLLFERTSARLGIAHEDLEITITETPRVNWGIRGVPADELGLSYKVEV